MDLRETLLLGCALNLKGEGVATSARLPGGWMASRSPEYQPAGRWRSLNCSQQEEAGLLPPGGLVPDTQSRLCPQIRQRTAAVVSPAPSSWHFWRVVAPRFLMWAQIILLARTPRPLKHTHTHMRPIRGLNAAPPPKKSNTEPRLHLFLAQWSKMVPNSGCLSISLKAATSSVAHRTWELRRLPSSNYHPFNKYP